MSIQKQIDKIQAELDTVKELFANTREPKWPQYGDEYWTYESDKEIAHHVWRASPRDNYRKANHMCFHRREHAVLSMQQGLAYRMLRGMADDGCWTLRKSVDGGYYAYPDSRPGLYGMPGFSSDKKALMAIKEIGEELLDTIFEPGEK